MQHAQFAPFLLPPHKKSSIGQVITHNIQTPVNCQSENVSAMDVMSLNLLIFIFPKRLNTETGKLLTSSTMF